MTTEHYADMAKSIMVREQELGLLMSRDEKKSVILGTEVNDEGYGNLRTEQNALRDEFLSVRPMLDFVLECVAGLEMKTSISQSTGKKLTQDLNRVCVKFCGFSEPVFKRLSLHVKGFCKLGNAGEFTERRYKTATWGPG